MAEPVIHHIQVRSRFVPLTDDDIQLFNLYQKSIDAKIRETFPSIPADFELKPVRICRTQGCGTFYDYKVAVPDNKFATVSFHTGGMVLKMGPDSEKTKPEEPSFRVNPELTSTPDE